MEVLSDYRTRQRKDNRLPTHLSECHALAALGSAPRLHQVSKGGRNAGPRGHLASPPARAQGLLATLPARPPERGASWPPCRPAPREHATLRKRIPVSVSSASLLP